MELIEYKDMFGIYHRVKEIRPSYRLFFNRKTKKAELYDINYGGKCMTFDLPLNASVLDKINATRVENAPVIFRKIAEENSKNQVNSVKKATEIVSDMFLD